MSQSQEALELQTNAAREQISRLEELVARNAELNGYYFQPSELAAASGSILTKATELQVLYN